MRPRLERVVTGQCLTCLIFNLSIPKVDRKVNAKFVVKFIVLVMKVNFGHNFQVFGHTRRAVVTFADENLQSFCRCIEGGSATWHWSCFMAPVFSFVLLVKPFLRCITPGHNQICPLLSLVSLSDICQTL